MTVYKLIEVVGTSGTSIDDAVRGAIKRASATVSDLQWFEVKEIRGKIDGSNRPEFQVTIDMGFLVRAPDHVADRPARDRETPSRQARSTAAQLVGKKGGRKQSGLARSFEKQRK